MAMRAMSMPQMSMPARWRRRYVKAASGLPFCVAAHRTRIRPAAARRGGPGPRRALILVWAVGLAMAPGFAAARSAPGYNVLRPPEEEVPSSRPAITLSFAPVVRMVAPAVVNIYTKRVVRQANTSPLQKDPFYRRFFADEQAGGGSPGERVQSALGSGVIVRPEGIVVTNAHVVRDSDEITVALADRRQFEAELIIADSRTDLAVLRIHPGGKALPYLHFRDSDSVAVGDLVLAVGDPFGVGQTVSSGIVSALARAQRDSADYQFFIQTDAAINPGNSGGALVTMDGRLIGINTAILSSSVGTPVGIGFAVPSNVVRNVVDAALGSGMIVRPWLGASGQAVRREFAPSLGLDRPIGVLIQRVFAGGPADQAGLKVGDIVLSVDGFEVFDEPGLEYRIATRRDGEGVRLEVMREGIRISLTVTARRPPEIPPRDLTTLEGHHALAGAVIGNLSPAFAVELGLDPMMAHGVVVADVAPGSPAEQVGVKPRDVILSINGEGIGSIKEVMQAVQDSTGRWRVTVRRRDRLLAFDVTR
jgi:serine protease Do